MDTTPTSPTKTFKSLAKPRPRGLWSLSRHSSGFTLIEILIVIGLIAAAIAMASPRLFKQEGNIKSAARRFMVMGKEIRNHARLSGKTYRLVLDLDPQEPKYWVEKSESRAVIDPDAPEKEKKAKEEAKEGEAPSTQWAMDEKIFKKKQTLPRGIYFGAVETLHMKAPVTDGIAYVHFFPEGLIEAATVQITDRAKKNWTLVFNPLSGQADILEETKSLKDITR